MKLLEERMLISRKGLRSSTKEGLESWSEEVRLRGVCESILVLR